MACLENEDPKTLRSRKLERSKPKPSIWLSLGLKLVFRPRASQGQYMHPTGNEDVRPHVERGYLLKYGGSPNFHFETSYSERRP